jgi:hypothetical protein
MDDEFNHVIAEIMLAHLAERPGESRRISEDDSAISNQGR